MGVVRMNSRETINIIERLNEAVAGDVNGKMSLNGINYDQKHGIGNVGDNCNVAYLGFVCLMTPKQFLGLAEYRNFEEDSNVDFITKSISEGVPIGSPFLDVELSEDGLPARVRNHEGRTRVEAIDRLYPGSPVLVAIFPRHGLRARHISVEMIKSFQTSAIPQRENAPVPGPHFGNDVFLNGKWITI